ncbi:MAG: histidine phosphatase family protein [Rhodospirillales bacterium]
MIKRIACMIALMCLGTNLAQADTALWSKLHEPGHFAIIRHATAPGTGDPDHFKVDDCSTQRNLNETGRKEAEALGHTLRNAGIDQAAVYSSQWCRCLETARLLKLGPVMELPALNSFYQRHRDQAGNLKAIRAFIQEKITDLAPVILVTHQVTINALTDRYTRQGEALILKHTGNGDVAIVGSISPG